MITAAQVNTLKQKVKAEMTRRNQFGSLSTDTGHGWAVDGQAINYADSAYDFTTTPAIGEHINAEHGQKTIDLLLKINDHNNLPTTAQGNKIPDGFNEELITWVDTLAEEPMVGSSSSCKGKCTGLCVSTCATGCTSCTSCSGCSGCSDVCTGCTNSCTDSCSGCGGSCSYNCSGGCEGTCKGDCDSCGGCDVSCIMTCYQSCTHGCAEACDTACDADCADDCYHTCDGTCKWLCADYSQ